MFNGVTQWRQWFIWRVNWWRYITYSGLRDLLCCVPKSNEYVWIMRGDMRRAALGNVFIIIMWTWSWQALFPKLHNINWYVVLYLNALSTWEFCVEKPVWDIVALVNVFINTYVHFTTSTTTYHELAYFCENEKSSYPYIDWYINKIYHLGITNWPIVEEDISRSIPRVINERTPANGLQRDLGLSSNASFKIETCSLKYITWNGIVLSKHKLSKRFF